MPKTQKTTIENIPPEVLCEIFKKLDINALKMCCLVSPKWNNVISTSPDFLNRAALVILTSSLSKKDLSTKPTRSYRNLKISDVPEKMTNLQQIVYGPRIDCDILTKVISNVSPACTNLKSFEVTFLHSDVNTDVQNLLVEIKEANSHSLERLIIGEFENSQTWIWMNSRSSEVFFQNIWWLTNATSQRISLMQIYDDTY